MHRALGAGGLPFPKTTLFQPLMGIMQKAFAFRAKRHFLRMDSFAIEPHHRRNGPLVPTDIERQWTAKGQLFFFPMEAPHFPQVKEEKRNPGLGRTAAPQAGQTPPPDE
jgi:hypothetical protein